MKQLIIMAWMIPVLIGIGTAMLIYPDPLPWAFVISYAVTVTVYAGIFWYLVYKDGLKTKKALQSRQP